METATNNFLARLGDEVEEAKTFELFSQPPSSKDLGMLEPKTATIELCIAGRDYSIAQSPGKLQSNRDGGTTGAAVWQTGVRFAEWLQAPHNVLFADGLLNSESVVLELGSGIAGLIPIVLSERVRRVIPTDQPYLLKELRENIVVNTASNRSTKVKGKASTRKGSSQPQPSNKIDVVALDWETDDVQSVMNANGLSQGVDCVIACDCLYNYSLVDPFVQACADIGSLAGATNSESLPRLPTVVLVAQQLRQPEVFEQWLEAALQKFRVWRLPDGLLTSDLKEESGFSVHVCLLRDS